MNRKRIVAKLFEISQNVYVKHFKKNKKPWNVDREALLSYPKNSLGRALGRFLVINDFQLLPKVECHDAYHVLVNYGTTPEDEIALQYLCFGNGKRSPYLIGVILLGTLLLPEYFCYYLHSYRIGKRAHSFHHYDYEKLLSQHLNGLRATFFGKDLEQNINHLRACLSADKVGKRNLKWKVNIAFQHWHRNIKSQLSSKTIIHLIF